MWNRVTQPAWGKWEEIPCWNKPHVLFFALKVKNRKLWFLPVKINNFSPVLVNTVRQAMCHSPHTLFLYCMHHFVCKGWDCSGWKSEFEKTDTPKLSLKVKDALKYLCVNRIYFPFNTWPPQSTTVTCCSVTTLLSYHLTVLNMSKLRLRTTLQISKETNKS